MCWSWEEAASRLLKEHEPFVTAHARVPWRLMKGMRNRIAHSASDIDVDLVWEAVDVHIVNLLEQLPALRVAATGNG